MPYLLILIPFLALILINFIPKGKSLVPAFWVCLLLFSAQALAVVALFFNAGPAGIGRLESLLGFRLFIDRTSLALLLSVGLVGATALLSGWSLIKKEDQQFNFINLVLIALIGINGISMTTDLFTLYVFIEVVAVASFIMIALFKDRDAFEGVFKYLVMSVVASLLMLSSISFFLLAANGTSFAAIRAAAAVPGSFVTQAALGLFVCGLLIKGGLIPFHGWLPDAYMSAPAPVSVFLAGIVTKASGIFTLIRLVRVVGLNANLSEILLVVGTLSIVAGALAALGQKDMKRMLAYSSISQMGYIIAALGTGTALGFAAALFHFFNHAIFKSQLFINAAAVEEETGTRDMDRLGGLAARMPVTGITSVIASLSTAGVPPLAGFWSKLLIIIALWSSGHVGYAAIALLASVLTLGYFLSMQRRVFFGRLLPELENIKEGAAGLIIPAVVLSTITVGVGLVFPFFLNLFVK
ncbi:MAG: proton-conducting transporter membrane subunit [Candidatus Margulisbacteria bacterium]|nr:proton-conducting transporter membrane subunit [Candidatus Margulisiibacteriota bacterium]